MTPERDVREAFDNWLTQNSGYAPSFINPDERAFGLKAYAAGHSAALSQGRATTAEGDDWKRRYEDEYAIVDRCWKALGITTYEQANGRAIHEIIATLKAERDAAVALLRDLIAAVDAGSLEMNSPEIGEPESGIPYHAWHDEWLHYARAAALKGDAKPATEER